MKRFTAILCLAALLLGCSGCSSALALPYGREVENMALMRTLGVDGVDGGVKVTVSSGVQSKGAEKGDQPPLVLSREAGTVSGACLAMQSYGETDIFYGHVGQLLLGQELAERGIAEALDYVERDIEMRLDTEVYIIKEGAASDALFALAGEGSAADRLEALSDDAGLMAASTPRTVKDLLAGFSRSGAAFAPALTLTSRRQGDGGSGEKYDLSAAGYAIFKDGILAGWAEGEAARGVNLLLGQADADIIELDRSGASALALRVVGAKSAIRPVFRDGALTGLSVTCAVEANVAEAPAGLDLGEPSVVEGLETALAEVEEARIRAALDLSQSLDADFLGLNKRAGLAEPWHWDVIRRQWDACFSGLDISFEVAGRVQRSYDVK